MPRGTCCCGAYGSRTAAPRIEAEEFRQASTSALRPEPMANVKIICELCANLLGHLSTIEEICFDKLSFLDVFVLFVSKYQSAIIYN